MRVQVAIPEERIDQPVLDAALEAVTRLNESMLRAGEIPTFQQAVHRVRWQPEPPGQEHFDHAGVVLARGHGDCDDLAPWHAASLRATGVDPGAIATVYESGPKRWHAVVQRSDGQLEDPSAAAGMPTHSGHRPAAVPPMGNAVVGAYMIRPQIALTPRWGEWGGRVDLPWHWEEEIMHGQANPTDWAMTTLHAAPTAATALTGAIVGAIDLASHCPCAEPEHIARLCCLAGAAEGYGYDDLASEFGDQHARAAIAVVGAVYGSLREQYGLDPEVGSLDDLMGDVLPVAKEVLPAVAAAIPAVGPALSPVVRYGLELADKEYRAGRAPKLRHKSAAKKAHPAPHAAAHPPAHHPAHHASTPKRVLHDEHKRRWICVPQ